ncbi:uncharacterized protein LOC125947252 [Dermacentor silvarum]|uniref:uncharacterized protein LOC125947252 n=1 Tax=Dermacentor silvarum TaxID=543639 RepID=UPI002100A48A|nr:uncharacterized protein LOC125947252 [Dermacentor silvarum]
MAHPVQVLYSLHSRKGKRAFINLKLCRIVTDVICAKGGGDLTQAQDFIKWLPGSVDSGGGRKRRFTATFAAEQLDDPSLQGRNHCLPTAALSLPHPCPQVPGKSTFGPSCPAAAAPAPSPAAAPAAPHILAVTRPLSKKLFLVKNIDMSAAIDDMDERPEAVLEEDGYLFYSHAWLALRLPRVRYGGRVWLGTWQ